MYSFFVGFEFWKRGMVNLEFRKDSEKTISEVDRILKQGGYLVITDFETPFPIKRKYEHFEGCFSYKNNYPNFFLGGGHYSLVNKIHFSHSTDIFNPDINERVSTSVLYKEHYSKIYRLG